VNYTISNGAFWTPSTPDGIALPFRRQVPGKRCSGLPAAMELGKPAPLRRVVLVVSPDCPDA
jgi:hypothetical protein